MWIEELSNGKYKYIERYTDPLTKKYKKVSVTLDKNSSQAQKKASLILQEKIEDKLAIREYDEMTYGELKKEFIKQWKPTVKDSTIRSYTVADKHLTTVISDDTLINKITKRDVRLIIEKLLKQNTFHVTHKCRKRLHAIFAYAIKMDYMASNPTENVLVPKPKENYIPEKVLFLTSDEVYNLCGRMIDNNEQTLADVVLFMFLTGVRYGELACLTYDKIDFENKEITINATYDFHTRKTTTTKTQKSTRKISVSDNILDIIKRQKKTSNYIFPNSNGVPILNAYINKRLKIYGDYHTHLFRHSHISFLAEKGIPLNAIMDRVGHSDPKTTLSIYGHTTVNMKEIINKQTAPFMLLLKNE
ncbi:prophage LambdaSa1, site-specific recombinase phage integrase family protein [Streptococcus porcinus]|uniref:tyrosine-type recombinase/integrase n=1 Tax=Streptococcus porcinus TaxID=1340 RepID=UPI0010CACE01|nr:site-specific integrase [Streptococcus porcinus]VTS33483.1 prophage LambdaSa1, site-specific recombinase phage integrase family protein [Streptococcus porcinus]